MSRRDVFNGAAFDAPQATAHAGLWLDKFLPANVAQPKTELVKQVAKISIRPEYRKSFERWERMLEAYNAQSHPATVNGCHMVVGVGAESVLENSISLHHTYGVPYIPGSALKGLAANFARHRLGGAEWQKDGAYYKTIFGDTQTAGFITFFDALLDPASGNRPLHVDVLTVHHKQYYGSGSVAPADWDSPEPVPFLSATGRYLVALAGPDKDWENVTFRILQQALQEEGIGAKTSSGYGRMTLNLNL